MLALSVISAEVRVVYNVSHEKLEATALPWLCRRCLVRWKPNTPLANSLSRSCVGWWFRYRCDQDAHTPSHRWRSFRFPATQFRSKVRLLSVVFRSELRLLSASRRFQPRMRRRLFASRVFRNSTLRNAMCCVTSVGWLEPRPHAFHDPGFPGVDPPHRVGSEAKTTGYRMLQSKPTSLPRLLREVAMGCDACTGIRGKRR